MGRPTKEVQLDKLLRTLKAHGVFKFKSGDMEVEMFMPGVADVPKMRLADLDDEEIKKQAIRETIAQARAREKDEDDLTFHSS